MASAKSEYCEYDFDDELKNFTISSRKDPMSLQDIAYMSSEELDKIEPLRFSKMNGKLKKEILALCENPKFRYVRITEYYENFLRNGSGGSGSEEYRFDEGWSMFRNNVEEIYHALQEREKYCAMQEREKERIEPGKRSFIVAFGLDFCEFYDGKVIAGMQFAKEMYPRFSKFC